MAVGAALAPTTQSPVEVGNDALQAAQTRLKDVHDTTSAYVGARPYLTALVGEAGEVAGLLQERSLPAGDLQSAAKDLRSVDPWDDPARAGTAVAAAVQPVLSTARSAILGPSGSSTNDAIEALLAGGALIEAAQQLPRAGVGLKLGGQTASVAPLPSTTTPQVIRSPLVVLAQHRAPISDSLDPGPRPAARALVGGLAGLLHILVAAVIVGCTGYALFLPTWIGSFADVSKIWAFAIDVSVAGLTLLPTPRA